MQSIPRVASPWSNFIAGLVCHASNVPDVLINVEFIWWSFTAGIVIMMTLKDVLRPWSHLGHLKMYLSFSSIRFTVLLGYFYCPVSFQCEVFVLHASGVRCDEWHGKLKVLSQNTQAVGASAQSDSEGLWQVPSARDQLVIPEGVSVMLSYWVGSNPVLASKMISAEIYLSRCFEQQRGCISVLSVTEAGVPTEEASDAAVMASSSWGVLPSAPWECPGHQPFAWGQQGWRPSSLKLRCGAASDRRLVGPARATFSRVWVQERRGLVSRGWSPAARADHLPVKTGKLQQRRKLSYSILGGQGSNFAAWKPTALAFRACI